MPLISIIIPSYNSEKFLACCLSSIAASPSQEFEVLVVDDGSTDKTLEIAQGFSLRDLRFKSLSQANRGQASARNLGITLAVGDYIWFVDSDDWIETEAISILRTAVENNLPDIVIFNWKIWNNYEYSLSNFGSDLWTAGTGVANKIFRRELWYNETFPLDVWYEDMAIIPVIVAKAKKITKLSDALYNYRTDNPSSQTNAVNSDRFFDMIRSARIAVSSLEKISEAEPDHSMLWGDWVSRFFTWQVYLNGMLNKSLSIKAFRDRKFFLCKYTHSTQDIPEVDFQYIISLSGLTAALGAHFYLRGHYRLGDVAWRIPRKIKSFIFR